MPRRMRNFFPRWISGPGRAARPGLYELLDALKADSSPGYDDWRRNLRFTPLDRLDSSLLAAEAMIAECALCPGDEVECFTVMDRCVERMRREGLPYEIEMAVVWRAAMYLWTGRYEEARPEPTRTSSCTRIVAAQ